MLPGLIRDVIDFCYPGFCARCRASCEPGALLCDPCAATLDLLARAAACLRCGAPLAHEGMPCPFCQDKGVRHYRQVLRLGTFDEPLKELIHQFKYHRRWAIGEALAQRLFEREAVKALLANVDVLVPVPLHLVRQFTRGYNQAAVIAGLVSRESGKPIVNPIRRVRHTPSQTQIHSRKQRTANLRDAFRLVGPEAIRGNRVLVIDDVMTSGATLQSFARALRPARPKSLHALVLAVADPKHRGFQAV